MLFWDSAPSSVLVRATGRAQQGSTECQGSPSCWQASPKGTIFCCHRLPASFLLLAFWRKSPWKCPPSLPHSSSLLCPLPPAPVKHAVPLSPIHWDNWWFPKLSSACSPEKAACGIRDESRVCCPCCPSPIYALPLILRGVCEAEIAFFS